MPIYTQTRRPQDLPTTSAFQNGVLLTPGSVKGKPFDQQLGTNWLHQERTTGYRTGRRTDDLVPDGESQLLATTSRRGLQKVLADEYAQARTNSFDTGHVFQSDKYLYDNLTEVDTQSTVSGTTRRYVGPVLIDTASQLGKSNFQGLTASSANYYGTLAVKTLSPTHPAADMAVNLAEFKSEGARLGLNSYELRNGVEQARKAGDDYLNSQFGWLPLAGAIQDMAKSFRHSREIISQYIRDSGKPIRRGMSFPVERTASTTQTSGNLLLPFMSGSENLFVGGVKSGTMYQTVSTERRYWFSGAFTYHLALGDSFLQKMDRYEEECNKLFGTRMTPEVMWNLAPWSWLSDWNWNIGDVISNATALADDGLVILYGYLMCHTRVKHDVLLVGPQFRSGATGNTWRTTFISERKERVRANPFGFGSDPNSYTSRQWAILGALGLTNAPRALRQIV